MNRLPSPFGGELRRWRERRGVSQLRLASIASMSPRYVSFVETGRSRPSRNVVERLADALDIPLRSRNRLLVAAGLAASYPEGSLDDVALSTFRGVVESLLAKHEPYPAFVLDRTYCLHSMNQAARRIVSMANSSSDWLDAFFSPESPLRAATENFAEVAWAALDLLRHELDGADGLEGDPRLRLERHLAGVPRPTSSRDGDDRVMLARFRFGDRLVRTVTTIARFGSARDVLLDELRVELVFPADEESARFFHELAAGA